jgi:hypothetical protein
MASGYWNWDAVSDGLPLRRGVVGMEWVLVEGGSVVGLVPCGFWWKEVVLQVLVP